MKVSSFPSEIVKFGRILVFLQEQAPTGGGKTTTVNHFALQVPDIRKMLNKDLGDLCARLEGMGIRLDRPDPWGTRIELTEGLDSVS